MDMSKTPNTRRKQAADQNSAVETCVEGSAGGGADEVDEEDLDRPDPGDCGQGNVERGCLVGLEEAKGGQVAQAIDEHQVAHEDLGPCSDAAVWGKGGNGLQPF